MTRHNICCRVTHQQQLAPPRHADTAGVDSADSGAGGDIVPRCKAEDVSRDGADIETPDNGNRQIVPDDTKLEEMTGVSCNIDKKVVCYILVPAYNITRGCAQVFKVTIINSRPRKMSVNLKSLVFGDTGVGKSSAIKLLSTGRRYN